MSGSAPASETKVSKEVVYCTSARNFLIRTYLQHLVRHQLHWDGERPAMPLRVLHHWPRDTVCFLFGEPILILTSKEDVVRCLGPDIAEKHFIGGSWATVVPPVFLKDREMWITYDFYRQNGEFEPRRLRDAVLSAYEMCCQLILPRRITSASQHYLIQCPECRWRVYRSSGPARS